MYLPALGAACGSLPVAAKSKTVPSAEMVAEETGFLAAAGLSVYDAYNFE